METPFPWIWVNGVIVKRQEFQLDPYDDGLLFGLGLFETTRTFEGIPWLWEAHRQRLLSAAHFLGIVIDERRLPAPDDVLEFVNVQKAGDVVIRLNVSAGASDRRGLVWMHARPLPPSRKGAQLRTSSVRVSMHDPVANHKCFSYASRMLAHREAAKSGADDALLLDPTNLVLETATANLFIRMPQGWVTPPLGGGVLNGTVRELLLEYHEPPDIRTQHFTHSRIAHGLEAFITNSVHGVTPVVRIDDISFEIGEETKRLQQWVLSRR